MMLVVKHHVRYQRLLGCCPITLCTCVEWGSNLIWQPTWKHCSTNFIHHWPWCDAWEKAQ